MPSTPLNPVLVGPHTHKLISKVPLLEQEIDAGLTQSTRNRRNPVRFQDYVPTSKVPSQIGCFLTKKQQAEAAKARMEATQVDQEPESPSGEGSGKDIGLVAAQQIVTSPDSFGIFQKYTSLSSHNPDDVNPFADMGSQAPPAREANSNLATSSTRKDPGLDPLANSKNPSVDLLLSWYSEGSRDGATSLDHLVNNCLLHPSFEKSDLEGFSAVSALRRFEKDHLSSQSGTTLEPGDGWKCGKVTICVPCTGYKQREEDAPEFTVDGIYYRDTVEVITKELMDPDSFEDIHIRLFEEWWRPTDDSDPVRVYSDVYTSDTMLQLERELEETLKTAGDPQSEVLETFILAVLLYSDATNLAQFGQASLWPVYMFIGNTSKHIQSRPNSFSAHHIAYLPTVRDPIILPCPMFVSPHVLSYQTRSRILLRALWDISEC
jgi:hypothetical protein